MDMLINKINSIRLPFFGKINSIASIDILEDENSAKYISIKRYGIYGNLKKEKYDIQINLKNIHGIFYDISKDIEDYLIKYKNKYNECRKNKKVFNTNISFKQLNKFDKICKIGICLGTMLIGLTFSVISLPTLFISGIAILVISGVGELIISDITKELKENNFVLGYDNYCIKLSEFKSYLDNKFKIEATKYNGLINEKNHGNSLKLKKIKTLN